MGKNKNLIVNMDSLVLLLLIPALHLVHAAHSQVSVQPTVEFVSGQSKVFSGENLKLRCQVLDDYNSAWSIQWFRDLQLLPREGDVLYLRRVSVEANGKYSCRGVRGTDLGNLYTKSSPPVEVQVDGGWAILHNPQNRTLVGTTLELSCDLRNNPKVREVILYKNGVEVMRNGQLNQRFYLSNVTLADTGHYSCRASWDIQRQTYSVISTPTYVEILEILTKPVLVMVTNDPKIPATKLRLECHVQYNAPDPAPAAHYYFYQQDTQVAPASSLNHVLLSRQPGLYTCKVRVPQLGLLRLSEARRFR
ncbi:low affinity immunoglobulin gamma Fc region receptor III-B-like [Synchiropus picturatus]